MSPDTKLAIDKNTRSGNKKVTNQQNIKLIRRNQRNQYKKIRLKQVEEQSD